jgi:hypothetical protein
MIRVFGDKLNIYVGGKRYSFVAGIPRRDIVDLAGVAAAVVFDSNFVNAGFGERSENNGLVAGAYIVDGGGGHGFGCVIHGKSPCAFR